MEFSSLELCIFVMLFLSIGSFVSTLIYRFSPKNNLSLYKLFIERSNCDKCKSQINSYHLIPIIGYIFQAGKCKKCNHKISIFYPITEIFFCLLGIGIIYTYGLSIFSAYLIMLSIGFYTLFFLDFKYLYLPLSINLSIFLIGFSGNVFFSFSLDETITFFNLSPITFSLSGFLIGYSFLFIINFLYKKISTKDGIGGGDFILFGGIGSIFGPFSLGLILFISSLTGIIFHIAKKEKNSTEIPFGSFLILGSVIYFFIKRYELFKNYLVI